MSLARIQIKQAEKDKLKELIQQQVFPLPKRLRLSTIIRPILERSNLSLHHSVLVVCTGTRVHRGAGTGGQTERTSVSNGNGDFGRIECVRAGQPGCRGLARHEQCNESERLMRGRVK
eukprot:SAG31_NODE_1775_length_7303_cov_2.409356_6_plen_118_part_00